MGRRKGSYRRKTRSLMKKNYRDKGKISISKFFASFTDGETVALKAEPAVQKGIYHLRYHGRTAIVKGKRGNCYELELIDGKKSKTLIVHPVHLTRLK